MVDESNFKKICLVLHSEESFTGLVSDVVSYYSILSSMAEMDYEEMNLDTLLQILTNKQFLNKTENKQINKYKPFSKPNKKQGFIKLLSLKPLNCFSKFLRHLESETTLHHLQMKILNKMSEINNDISYTRSASTNTLASLQSSGRASRQHGGTMHKSTSSPSELEASYNSCQAELTRSSSFPSCTKLSETSTPTSPTKKLQQEPSSLDIYKEHLKHAHQALPILSRQGWTNSSNMNDHFINVTIVKPLHKGGQNIEYSTSSNEILEHQIQYSFEVYKIYNKMFEAIDSKNRQLILLEGNAGTGKTTFAYKICKEWARENELLQYSHVILLQLRDIKPSTINNTAEHLFFNMGKLKHQIYADLVAKLGSGVLFWLEGWDELHDDLKFQSVFTELLSGHLFPQATVVVSTRPAATGSLRKFYDFTHKFKLVGFKPKQIEEYVQYYCTSLNQAEKFMEQLKYVPCLAQLAEVPLNLAILIKLLKKANQDLPNTLTEIFYSYLMNALQHHKDKSSRGRRLLNSTTSLPSEMQKIFNVLTKYAFEYLFHHKPFSEEEISYEVFNSSDIPWDFDGLGLFKIYHTEKLTGESKDYLFLHKPIQELLAVLYLITLQPQERLLELKEIFGNKAYEMVWVFYGGMTGLSNIDEILKQNFINLPQKQSQSVMHASASENPYRFS